MTSNKEIKIIEQNYTSTGGSNTSPAQYDDLQQKHTKPRELRQQNLTGNGHPPDQYSKMRVK
jgi:hypothetical protein